MFRHWNAWDEGTRSHLFVVGVDGGAPRDLMPGAKYDMPVGPFGGAENYNLSPDGRELSYTAKDQGRADAWTTDLNLYTVSVTGGAATVITSANKGADQNPVYSPDGKYIAYSSQRRAGFESDRWRLMLYDRAAKTTRELLPTWDRNADAVMWAPDMSALYVMTADNGRDKLYRVCTRSRRRAEGDRRSAAVDRRPQQLGVLTRARRTHARVDARRRAIPGRGVHGDDCGDGAAGRARADERKRVAHRALVDESGGRLLVYRRRGAQGAGLPREAAEVASGEEVSGDSADSRRTAGRVARQLAQSLELSDVRGDRRRLGDHLLNPRGSSGYGQKFVDDVSKEWGGKVYTDLMNGLDAALTKYPWIDKRAVGAAGGSYGGYMVNWIDGHTNRFKALVSHAGPFNLENMATATEELWFPDWEYGGPPWDPKAMASQYRVYSPHLYVKNFKTPTLVTRGELDYRVPYTEHLSMFTALQRQNVPSRLVMFPDEGHWILKPQNQRLWWKEVQGWLGKYIGAPRI